MQNYSFPPSLSPLENLVFTESVFWSIVAMIDGLQRWLPLCFLSTVRCYYLLTSWSSHDQVFSCVSESKFSYPDLKFKLQTGGFKQDFCPTKCFCWLQIRPSSVHWPSPQLWQTCQIFFGTTWHNGKSLGKLETKKDVLVYNIETGPYSIQKDIRKLCDLAGRNSWLKNLLASGRFSGPSY